MMTIIKNLLITILLLCFTNVNAQTEKINKSASSIETESSINQVHSKNFYIGLGGSYSSFQDVRYSKVQYSGSGANLEIGYNKKKGEYFWEMALVANYSKENAKTHSSGKATVINPSLYFKYLRAINENFHIGGRIDLMDLYFRTTQGLGNNSTYYINSSSLFGSLMYNKKLNDNWNIESSLDLGLLSFMKESTSFGFSAPQKPLEDGEFNYQNKDLESPFGYKYFQLKHIGNNLNVKTSFLFQYKSRVSIGYVWNIRHFANSKSYPVTTGMHNVIFRYNIFHKK